MFGGVKRAWKKAWAEGSSDGEFERLLLDTFDRLQGAIDAERGVARIFAVSTCLTALIVTVRTHFPNINVDDGGVAASVIKNAANGDLDAVDADIAYLVDQMGKRPDDRMWRVVLIYNLLDPVRVQNLLAAESR